MKMEQELARLNEYQRAAVINDSRACLVNACVGSGKTTVLVNKVQYLHEVKGIALSDMLVLTFTNKAANEIMERLQKQEEPLIGTFHSVALWMLRNCLPIEQYGFTKDFLVIDPDEEIEMAMLLIAEHKLNIKYKNRLKKRLEKAMFIEDEAQKISRYQDDIFILVSLLQQEKQHQNKMSFYDLLKYCEQLQKNGKWYPMYIVVDEVQDCDMHQLQFLQAFMGEQTHLFAVGDPNQVIYSWRGGDLNIFYRMKHMFDAEELHLPVNYRSSSSILEAAKCFLQNGDALEGSREQGTKIVIQKQYDSFQDANAIAEKIHLLHEKGLPYTEIAVFYRLQSQSDIFTKVFDREGIPYQISQKKTIRDIPVLNWLLKILHVCVNPKDKTSLLLAVTNKEFGCGMTEAKLRKAIKEQKNLPALYEQLLHFQNEMVPVMSASGMEIEQHKEQFVSYFDLRAHLRPTSADYIENARAVDSFLNRMFSYIEERQSSISEVEKRQKCYIEDMLEFLNASALQGVDFSQEKERRQEDYVHLMTLHASKGLEFSQVFITGVNYGWIPMQSKGMEGEEEERRLFFVGITRAKDSLDMSYYTNPGSVRVMSGPSRYLEMVPRHLIAQEDISKATMAEQSQPTDIFQLQNLRKQVQLEQMKKKLAHSTVGEVLGRLDMESHQDMEQQKKQEIFTTDAHDLKQVKEKQTALRKVHHEKYGIGEVLREDDMMITVKFEGYGEKEFVKMLTKLTDIV